MTPTQWVQAWENADLTVRELFAALVAEIPQHGAREVARAVPQELVQRFRDEALKWATDGSTFAGSVQRRASIAPSDADLHELATALEQRLHISG